MVKISNEGKIKQNIDYIFKQALAVENYPQFAKNYTRSQIVAHINNHPIIEREAIINGQTLSWKTELVSTINQTQFKSIYFKQIDGPFKGLVSKWELKPELPGQTTLKIIHEMEEKKHQKPNEILTFFEDRLPQIADQFIHEFKIYCENPQPKNQTDLSHADVNDFFEQVKRENLNQKTEYADVHQGPFMKNNFENLDFRQFNQNPLKAKLLNLLFHFSFYASNRIKKFTNRYGKNFPVYGLLSQTTTYKNITRLMVQFIKETRQKNSSTENQLLSQAKVDWVTLELHTGSGNASAEFLISKLNKGKWIITDREEHNLPRINRSLEVNDLLTESINNINNNEEKPTPNRKPKIYAGIFDLAKLDLNHSITTKFDEMVVHMGAYFGNEDQVQQAFVKLTKLLKKGSILYLSGYTHPHSRKEAMREYLKSNFKGKALWQSLKAGNIWLSWLFILFVKITTMQWEKDIEKGNLYLLNNQRLQNLCQENHLKIVGNIDFTSRLNFGRDQSKICGFAVQKI